MAARPIGTQRNYRDTGDMDAARTAASSDQGAKLSQRIESLLTGSRRRGAPPSRVEVEDLYTDGCAEVLMLEAEQRTVGRRLAAARADIEARGDLRSVSEARRLSREFERIKSDLDGLRSDLRQLRAALEWAQSHTDIEQRIGLDQFRSASGETGR
jgi:hypothetical protein